jgi:hypothetical protein
MRSNVRDVKVQLIDDRVKAYVVFDVHGKDMTLQLEGRLGAQNGYLRFEPLSGEIGSLPIPQSTLESAVQRLMDSPENREKLKLPSEISDLRIQNGEVVASYKSNSTVGTVLPSSATDCLKCVVQAPARTPMWPSSKACEPSANFCTARDLQKSALTRA